MGSRMWVVFFHVSIFIDLVGLTIARSSNTGSECGNEDGRVMNQQYLENLDNVLYRLGEANSGYGFYNYSVGEEPNRVYAIALCRGDTDRDTCRRCVDDATRQITQDCVNWTQAVGWYGNDTCVLWYSDRVLLHTLDNNSSSMECSFGNVSSVYQFNVTLGTLLKRVREEAARGDFLRKYAVGNTSRPEIYALAQCTPDLSQSECSQCLDNAIDDIFKECYGADDVMADQPRCSLRYKLHRFYNETWYPSPPPLVPGPGALYGHALIISAETGKKSRLNIALVGTTLAAAAATMMAMLIFYIYRMRRWKRKDIVDDFSFENSNEDSTGEMNYFNLATIQAATNNFSLANKLGEGGFGPVYKGKLNDGKEIAVKRLSRNSGQGLEEFKTEVRLIIKLQHKNLVRLLGCCIKGNEKLLVYEYMANTSLDAFLFDPTKCKELDWSKRANIVCGIAKGLRYLHEDSRLKIVHRDMKASNVLLDHEMNPKISDFGTARIFESNQIEANTIGTFGYMAREYAMEGLFSNKSDVYSFGVLLLEIISGQRNNGFYHPEHVKTLLSYAWRLWKDGKGEQLIDRNLIENCPVSEALRWINIALLCAQEDPKDRPTMSSVVFMLEGQSTILPQPLEPSFSFATSDRSLITGVTSGYFLSNQMSTTDSS